MRARLVRRRAVKSGHPVGLQHRHEHHHARLVGLLALCILFGTLLTTGCGTLTEAGTASTSKAEQLAEYRTLAATCPAMPLLVDVRRDVSGSQDSPEIVAHGLAVVEDQVKLAVACAAVQGVGAINVMVFATNAAETAVVVSRELRISGATEIARLRKTPALVDEVMVEVRVIWDNAGADLTRNGSDVLSQFAVAGENVERMVASTNRDWALALTVITDGFSSRPKGLRSKKLAVEEAEALAAGLAKPNLGLVGQSSGSMVTGHESGDAALEGSAHAHAWRVNLVGIGKVSGKPPKTERIEAVKAFWRMWLGGAAQQVQVVTDWPTGGGWSSSDTAPSESSSAPDSGSPTTAER